MVTVKDKSEDRCQEDRKKTRMKKTKRKSSKLIAYLSIKSENCKIVQKKMQCFAKMVK